MSWISAAAVYFMMSEDDVRTALKLPWVTIGTDAYSFDAKGELAQDHPRAFGTFPRVIGKYARDEKVLTLPDAIRKMTSLPAARLGLTDRGLIRVGLWADAVVFDYDHIRDKATFQEPEAPPEGISQVLVNGVVVVDNGKSTGARPGQVIYDPGYSPSGSAITGAAN